MAKIAEILQIEKDRKDDYCTIHLFAEGGFYRAYNWSAWLLVTGGLSTPPVDKDTLRVTRKMLKSTNEDYVFVGFPIKSLDKYLPMKEAFTPVNNTQIDVRIILPENLDDIEQRYTEWKESFPLTEEKPKKEVIKEIEGNNYSSPRRISDILSAVLSYPLESKTQMENTLFISELKRQIAAIF